MISSPGCLCLMGFASGLITTRFWISDAPGSAQVVVLQVGPVDTWDVCLCRGGRTPIGGGMSSSSLSFAHQGKSCTAAVMGRLRS